MFFFTPSACLSWSQLNFHWDLLTTIYQAVKCTYSSIKLRFKAIIIDVSHGWLCVFVMHHFVITHLVVPHWHCSICHFNIAGESADAVQNNISVPLLLPQPTHVCFLLLSFLRSSWRRGLATWINWATALTGKLYLTLHRTVNTVRKIPTQEHSIRLEALHDHIPLKK